MDEQNLCLSRLLEWSEYHISQESPKGLFYYHGLTLIPAWISNHMPGKVWDEITYPVLNFNGCIVEV